MNNIRRFTDRAREVGASALQTHMAGIIMNVNGIEAALAYLDGLHRLGMAGTCQMFLFEVHEAAEAP